MFFTHSASHTKTSQQARITEISSILEQNFETKNQQGYIETTFNIFLVFFNNDGIFQVFFAPFFTA